MRLSRSIILTFLVAVMFSVAADAQRRTRPPAGKASSAPVQRSKEIGSTAVVMDETLSVLRAKPSLFAQSFQRMRRGRTVRILGVTEADGVKFYRVTAPPTSSGWVQADAVFGKFREGDDARLARLVFDQHSWQPRWRSARRSGFIQNQRGIKTLCVGTHPAAAGLP